MTKEYTIALIDTMHPVFAETLLQAGIKVIDLTASSREEILAFPERINGIAVRSRFTIDRDFIDRCPSLQLIARSGAGMESIDTDYAQTKGIACYNSPEGNRDAVAEHAIGMLLSLLNNIGNASTEVKSGNWLREKNRGIELGGKTIGIIGYGNTGSTLAKKLSGFGMKILAHDKYKKGFGDVNVTEATWEQIFAEADILSFHVPLNDETRFMANAALFNRFVKNIFLLNTARGPVVKTSDLVEGLRSGKIRGACLDVLEYEETSFESSPVSWPADKIPDPLRYLMNASNVILTPHIAGWTQESKRRLAEVLALKVTEHFSGK